MYARLLFVHKREQQLLTSGEEPEYGTFIVCPRNPIESKIARLLTTLESTIGSNFPHMPSECTIQM